jgi:succinylarginine dihydrolase
MSNVPCGITEVGVIKTISSFIFNSMLLPQGDGREMNVV